MKNYSLFLALMFKLSHFRNLVDWARGMLNVLTFVKSSCVGLLLFSVSYYVMHVPLVLVRITFTDESIIVIEFQVVQFVVMFCLVCHACSLRTF